MAGPGQRYSALFALADPSFPDSRPPRQQDAEKLMALAGRGEAGDAADAEEREAVQRILQLRTVQPFDKAAFRGHPLYNVGVDTPRVHRAAAHITDRIFEIFHQAAITELPAGLPLVIGGGCGLNCDWNRRWAECGHFSDVFVPPCANDSGSAIGTAVDAQVTLGGECRLEWDVYAGAEFEHDTQPDPAHWTTQPPDPRELAQRLADGVVVAFVRGRAEIGPRALGHRSLLATPLRAEMRDRLNAIKRRESYRPIAPCCLLEQQPQWFDSDRNDPHMLYFARVNTPALPAITHTDGTARVQSVGPDSDPALRELLQHTSALTGYGVLCNTSLNYPGLGFINRASELFPYCQQNNITDIIINNTWYVRRSADEPGSRDTPER
jgi:hydroxymethyl cephem carbamoyltransferase